MAAAFPAGNPGNTYVPSFEASGELTVHFSRNPKDFALNQWITLTPVKKSTGYFLRITPENAARIISADNAEFVWPDGQDAPQGEYNNESFEFIAYLTKRALFPFRLGYKAVDQASWKVVAVHAAMAAQQAMTARAVKAATLVNTQSNWAATHTATATTIAGGFLNTGTPTNPVVKIVFDYAAELILKDTLGVVRHKDLCVVMTPTVAKAISQGEEIHTYLKESPAALAQVRGDVPSQNGQWGLPDTLYNYKVVIEDTVRITSLKNAIATAPTTGYAFDANQVVIVARPGGLTSEAGGPNFSTVHQFSYEEMTVESKDDSDNRVHKGRVVEDYGMELVAPVSGFQVRAALS